MQKVSTPGIKTIAELMNFFGSSEEHFLKTVAYEADGELVLAAVRGDFNVSQTKLANHLKAVHLDFAPEDLLSKKGLHAGFLSPSESGGPVWCSTRRSPTNLFVAGANEPDTHYKDVARRRDFGFGRRVDITMVREGDLCAACGGSRLEIRRGIELGHTFKLGTKYTAPGSMDVTYLGNSGEPNRVVMGCYGIGVERLLASVVEKWHDESGMQFPITIAPYQVVVCPLGKKPEVLETAERVYTRLAASREVLFDDRDDSPGVKLKDADLLGIPVRIVVSQKLMKTGEVEIKVRRGVKSGFAPKKTSTPPSKRYLPPSNRRLEGCLYAGRRDLSFAIIYDVVYKTRSRLRASGQG